MIYLTLFYEFFKIGLFAIGGGLVTIPFLFDLSHKHSWFTAKELANMIAVSESTPGPVGINMATYSGVAATGIFGGLIATAGLVLPSLVIIMLIARIMKKYKDNQWIKATLSGIRPVVLALILGANIEIAKISFNNVTDFIVFFVFFAAIFYLKKSPILYISAAAVIGMVLRL